MTINVRLQNPLPDSTLIDIMNTNMRFLLFYSETRDLSYFRDTARKVEKVIRETKFQNPNSENTRNINEIQFSTPDLNDQESFDSIDPQIQMTSRKVKYNYSNIQCWNCMTLGHSYIYCPQEIKQPFFF